MSLSFCLPSLRAEYLHRCHLENHQKRNKGCSFSRAGFGSSRHTTTGQITLWIPSSPTTAPSQMSRTKKCKRWSPEQHFQCLQRDPFQGLRWHSVVRGGTAQPRSRRETSLHPALPLGKPGSFAFSRWQTRALELALVATGTLPLPASISPASLMWRALPNNYIGVIYRIIKNLEVTF